MNDTAKPRAHRPLAGLALLFAAVVCLTALTALSATQGPAAPVARLDANALPKNTNSTEDEAAHEDANEGEGEGEGEEECEEAEDEESTHRYAVVTGLGALALTMCGGYVVEDVLHITVLPEAGFAVIVGVVISGVFYAAQVGEGKHIDDVVRFDKEFFFVWLLPPIIFEAGYNMKRRAFFSNIGATVLYAFLGTFISTFIVGGIVYFAGQQGWCYELTTLNSLIFGALISATDPVTVLAVFQSLGVDINLFSMVFGESVLNDAVALVLYRTLIGFRCVDFTSATVGAAVLLFLEIFVFSFFIGVLLGMLSSFVFKLLDLRHHHNPHLEAALSAAFPWGAYFLAEAFGLSGIVAILFAGVTMSHYTYKNLSKDAQQLTRNSYKVIAKVAETFVFIYLGMSLFAFRSTPGGGSEGKLVMLENAKFKLVFVAVFACLFARVFNILPCSFLVNLFRNPPKTRPKVSGVFQFLLWWSGLRGGVAFAIAVANFEETGEDEQSLAILQTTLYVAAFTIFVFGGGITKLAVHFDVLEKGDDEEDEEVELVAYGEGERVGTLQRLDAKFHSALTHQTPAHTPAPQ